MVGGGNFDDDGLVVAGSDDVASLELAVAPDGAVVGTGSVGSGAGVGSGADGGSGAGGDGDEDVGA